MQAVNNALDGMLADTIASGAKWDPAAVFVSLVTAITNRGVSTVRTDVTEADLTDYPRNDVGTWGTPYRLVDGSAAVDGPLMVFTPPDDSSPVTIIGYAYFDAATAGNLLGFTLLDAQITLSVTTDHWNLVPRLMIPQSGRFESSHYWNG